LTIVKEESCDESKIMEAIKEIIPEAEVQSSLTAQVVINLPNENTDQFPNVFRVLEMNREQFSIKGMGISCTTMEEVFLKYFFFYIYIIKCIFYFCKVNMILLILSQIQSIIGKQF